IFFIILLFMFDYYGNLLTVLIFHIRSRKTIILIFPVYLAMQIYSYKIVSILPDNKGNKTNAAYFFPF
ncbi:MAG TPA: hypothetical protein VGD31_07980, partial [Sphingobacteriaceae bacterium]